MGRAVPRRRRRCIGFCCALQCGGITATVRPREAMRWLRCRAAIRRSSWPGDNPRPPWCACQQRFSSVWRRSKIWSKIGHFEQLSAPVCATRVSETAATAASLNRPRRTALGARPVLLHRYSTPAAGIVAMASRTAAAAEWGRRLTPTHSACMTATARAAASV